MCTTVCHTRLVCYGYFPTVNYGVVMFIGEAVTELWPPPPHSCLPHGLEEMPPGPELARVLAGIDLDSLSGFDLVVVMAAQARQVAHHQAELLATVARVAQASSEASALVADDDGEFAADEIRAALVSPGGRRHSCWSWLGSCAGSPRWLLPSAPG